MKKLENLISYVFALIAITWLVGVSTAKAESITVPSMSLSAPSISDLDQAQFEALSASSKWNIVGDVSGDYKITSPSSGSQSGTYIGGVGLVYDLHSVWHITLDFNPSSENVTITGISDYMKNGIHNNALDWSSSSPLHSVISSSTSGFGIAWIAGISGTINASEFLVNKSPTSGNLTANGSNPFDGKLFNNNSENIEHFGYTLAIDITAESLNSPNIGSINTSIFSQDSVTNVPEPSTWALFGIGFLVFISKVKSLKRT